MTVTPAHIEAVANLGCQGRTRHRNRLHAGARGAAGFHRRALRGRPGRDARRGAKLGGKASQINPLIPSELVIDHSVQVDVFGRADALDLNGKIEFERNMERYSFLRWGQKAFGNFKVVPPNTGIVHQVNLENLARVVMEREVDGELQAFPDTVFGTDTTPR